MGILIIEIHNTYIVMWVLALMISRMKFKLYSTKEKGISLMFFHTVLFPLEANTNILPSKPKLKTYRKSISFYRGDDFAAGI